MTTSKSLLETYQKEITRQTQQAFIHAVQQSDTYREKLTAYQAKHADETVPDKESIAMLDRIESFLLNVSSVYSTVISVRATPTVIEPPVQIPVVATQQKTAPTKEELIRLCRIRDAAFFEHMGSLNLFEKRHAPDAFECDETRVLAADEIIKPYLGKQRELRRDEIFVSKKINDALAAQRTWLDFIVENALPSFVLKAMGYMNFQALTQKKITELREKLSVINENLTNLEVEFHETWNKNYPNIQKPNHSNEADSNQVHKIVDHIECTELSNVYYRYSRNKTVSNLLDFYRLVHQLRLQAIQSDDKEIVAGQLTAIAEQLKLLHPDRLDNFATEQDCVARELTLFKQYPPVLPNIDQMTEKTAPFTKFMVHMEDKYATFIKARTLGHFSDLYQHIHSHPQYRHKNMVKDTRALLKSLYPQAYEKVREQQITHIDEGACDAFLKKYESLKLNHPIYVNLIAFMHNPTHEKLDAMKQEMMAINNDACYLDHRFNAAMGEFMTICRTISVEDCNSDAYSEGSDTQSDPGGRQSMNALEIPELTDDVKTQKLSLQNLRAQNEQFSAKNHLATSKHSLFAVTLKDATHREFSVHAQRSPQIYQSKKTT